VVAAGAYPVVFALSHSKAQVEYCGDDHQQPRLLIILEYKFLRRFNLGGLL